VSVRAQIRQAALLSGQPQEIVEAILAGLPNVMFWRSKDGTRSGYEVELEPVTLPMANWPHWYYG
jgi:hypothetical protein